MSLLKRNEPESTTPTSPPATPPAQSGTSTGEAFLPARTGRLRFESFAMRIVATAGVVGIGTALAAILAWQDVAGWIIGVVVSTVSVLLAAVLWSSRTL